MLGRYEESLRGQRKGFAIVLAVWGLVVVGGLLGVARSRMEVREADDGGGVDMVDLNKARIRPPGVVHSAGRSTTTSRVDVDPFAD